MRDDTLDEEIARLQAASLAVDEGYNPDGLEDTHLSQRIADDWLAGRYCWAAGLGWLKWDGAAGGLSQTPPSSRWYARPTAGTPRMRCPEVQTPAE